eukprot:12430142-Karenia_brevis.AAC.1
MAGAATEFTMHKTWELLQYPALKHKKLGAEAKEASDNLQAVIHGMSDEINALGSLPHGIEHAQQQTLVWNNWLKPQIEKVRHGQEL